MLADYKIWIGVIAVILTFVSQYPYMRDTWRGTNKPHMFSWLTWTIMTAIVLVAQISDGAGPGAWSTGVVLIPCVIITVLSFTKGEKNITRSDWVMFLTGLAAIPLWMVTKDPLWSVILVVGIDALAFGPTFRKSWHKPFEEDTFIYAVNMPRHTLSVLALSHYSVVTALYPVMLVIMNTLMYVMLKVRRRAIA